MSLQAILGVLAAMTAVAVVERRSALARRRRPDRSRPSRWRRSCGSAGAAEARRLLDFAFAGVPARPETALSIFAANARLLAAVFAADARRPVAVARRPRRSPRRGRERPAAALDTRARARGRAQHRRSSAPRWAPTAPGWLVAMLPHGPLELAAFALALALYLRPGARRSPRATSLAVGALCLGGLALAALLETFAVP